MCVTDFAKHSECGSSFTGSCTNFNPYIIVLFNITTHVCELLDSFEISVANCDAPVVRILHLYYLGPSDVNFYSHLSSLCLSKLYHQLLFVYIYREHTCIVSKIFAFNAFATYLFNTAIFSPKTE